MATGIKTAPITSNMDLQINAPVSPAQAEILTPEARRFVAKLAATFEARRQDLLACRRERQIKLDAGEFPDFLPETASIRAADWRVAPIPVDLTDRRVEITGPVDRKMVINALNSGASVFMADFEDANAPTWNNCLDGQVNLRDAIRRSIDTAKETQLTREDLLLALQREYEENDLFPPTDVTEDWMKLTDFDPENVIKLGPVRRAKADAQKSSVV